jgi:cell division protease FtsH
MNPLVKRVVFWMVIVISAMFLWQVVKSSPNKQQTSEISYSEFLSQVETGSVSKVIISKNQIDGRYRDDQSFRVTAPNSQEGMLQILHQKGVEIWFRDAPSGDSSTWVMNFAPIILLGALWFFMIRQLNLRKVQKQEGAVSQNADNRWSNR